MPIIKNNGIRFRRQAPLQGSRIRISGAGQSGRAFHMRRVGNQSQKIGPKISLSSVSKDAPGIRNFKTGSTSSGKHVSEKPKTNNINESSKRPEINMDTHYEMDVPGDETNLDFLMNPDQTNEQLLAENSEQGEDSEGSEIDVGDETNNENSDDDDDDYESESEDSSSHGNSHNNQHTTSGHSSSYNPSPKLSTEQIRMKKEDILFQFDRMRKKGIPVHKFTMSDRLDDMEAEYKRHVRSKKLENFNTVAKNALITSLTVLEWSNNVYDPFSLKLDGWSAAVQDDLEASNNQYEEVFEELYDKYADKAQMAPELKLCMLLGFSAMTHHLTQQRFANYNTSSAPMNGGQKHRQRNNNKRSASQQQQPSQPQRGTHLDRFASKNNGYIPPGGISVMEGPGSDIERGLHEYLPRQAAQQRPEILVSASSDSDDTTSDSD